MVLRFLGKLSLIIGIFVVSFYARFVLAETSKFAFTTPAQTVLIGTASSPVTVQSQNENGLAESLIETADLSFTSTSKTGQFLGSSGKPVSKTMAKGTANRTFYYSDSTIGTHTLTVTATGRISKKSFSATQQITIVSVLPPKPPVTKVPIKTAPVSTSNRSKSTKSTKSTTKIVSSQTDSNSASAVILATQNASTTDSNVIYEGVKKTSFFDSLIDWPSNFWKWLRSMF